jgi:hypothetical protein
MSSTGSTEPLLRDRALTSVRTRFPLLQQRSFPDQPLSLRSTMLSGTHQETRCTDPVFPMTTSPFSRISSYGRGQDSSSAQKQPMSSTIPVQPTQISPTAAEAQPLTPRPKHAPQSARGVPERSSMYKRSLVSSAARECFNWPERSSSKRTLRLPQGRRSSFPRSHCFNTSGDLDRRTLSCSSVVCSQSS